MGYKMNFRWKRLKTVPIVFIVLWVALFVSIIFCTVKAVISTSFWLDNTKNKTITVINASLYDSHNIKGSRFKLTIQSNEGKFYLWYPGNLFSKYNDAIEEYLLTGLENQVTVTYLKNSTVQDMVTGDCRIVDLRLNDIVLYHLNDAISHYQHSKFTYFVLSVALLLIWISESVMVIVIYGIVSVYPFRGAKKKK